MRTTPPSAWARTIATWLVIFPAVTLGQWILSGFPPLLPLAARAFVLTVIVVPFAVLAGIPAVLSVFGRARRRGARKVVS